MNRIHWVYKQFATLSPEEIYSILHIRSEVFIIEQHCNYLDPDNKDQEAWHLIGYDDTKLVAYCRILAPGVSYTTASIGRVLTKATHRKIGIGKLLMDKAIENTLNTFNVTEITISAQLYLQQYYESYGFLKISDVYYEDEIEHIKMKLKH